jgi:prolyl-tRNA editing enzyme YbaK/EbsC (Cys-tRNA(Pro) deacylase)
MADRSDQVADALASFNIEHEMVPCDPDLADTAEFCAHYGYALDDSANAIMVVGKSEPRVYAMCLILATTQVDVNKTVRKRLGTKKASFAPGEETTDITGMILGGVTPFGLPADLPLWIDSRVMGRERVIVGGGSRDRKVLLPPTGLLSLPNAEVVEDLAKERPPVG